MLLAHALLTLTVRELATVATRLQIAEPSPVPEADPRSSSPVKFWMSES